MLLLKDVLDAGSGRGTRSIVCVGRGFEVTFSNQCFQCTVA